MRWALSFAINRLFFLAVIALVLNNFFRTSCGIGNSYVEQFNEWFGVNELLRALDHPG
jgi:hypothetical protein